MAESTLPRETWVELTNADCTNFTLQNKGPSPIEVVRAGGVAPSDFSNSIQFKAGQGESQTALADFFIGGTGARIWAFATDGGALVSFYQN